MLFSPIVKTAPHEFPTYTKAERLVDAAIHVIGVVAAPIASLWLLTQVSGLAVTASLSVYCIGLITMLSVSALYNMLPNIPAREFVRRADHAVIFVMIAGTYTPVVVNRLEGDFAFYYGLFIWLAALGGVWLSLVHPHRYQRRKLFSYILLGWVAIIAIPPLSLSLKPVSFDLLLGGGFVYSLGAGFHAIGRLRFHNAIWHGFVLAAAAMHYVAMVLEFVP